MDKSYKYFAFISFQSADAKEAVRLQHTIEHYRLPAILCRQDTSIPKHVKPLYCYLNDMHSGEELMQELKSRMEQSRYLIVVCSPQAAKSTYINSGIDYFVSLGRRNCIIPVIVEGKPYSGDSETECFPEALRRHFPKHIDPLKDHSILGINIREAGISSHRQAYNRAMLMVVARMLQLDFDGLLLRDQQRKRRRQIVGVLLSLLIATILCLTWCLSQPVDVSVTIEEATPYNSDLPECKDISLNVFLENEQKSDTLAKLGDMSLLCNIPPLYIGKATRMTVFTKGYIPLDTMIYLRKKTILQIQRDAAIYGHVHFHIVGLSHAETANIKIANYIVHADKDGLVEFDIPISEQRTTYLVIINNHTDTLYMPCGEDAVIVVP